MSYKIGIYSGKEEISMQLEKDIAGYFDMHKTKMEVECWTEDDACIEDIKSDIFVPNLIFLFCTEETGDAKNICVYIRDNICNTNMEIVIISKSKDNLFGYFRFDVFDALCYPYLKKELFQILEKAYVGFVESPDYLVYKFNDEIIRVNYSDIMYMMNDKRYVKARTKGQGGHTFISTLEKEKERATDKFVIISRKYMINIDFIKSANKEYVTMENGEVLHVTDSHRKEYWKKIKTYFDVDSLHK